MSNLDWVGMLSDPEKEELRKALESSEKEVVEPTKLDHISKFHDEAIAIASNPYRMRGLATGYPKLDRLLCGLGKGELIILAGETSTGKSLMACNILLGAHLANELFTSLVFSLEMPNAEFIARMYMMYEEPEAFPMYFYDNRKGIDFARFHDALTRCKEENGLNLVVVDMTNSFPIKADSRTSATAEVIKELRHAAIEFEVPIIALHHVNRKPAGAADTDPTIDRLKDSSSVGQDADIVIMLKRDDTDQMNRSYITVFVRKNRNKGQTGQVNMQIDWRTLKVSEI